VLQFPECFCLDLTDTFARDAKLLADLLKCVIGVHADAETHAEHTFFARRKRRQNTRHGFFEVGLNRGINRDDRILIFDEITKMAVFLITNRGFKADRFLGDFHHLANFFERHRQAFGHFFRSRLAA
jgi:hypothetical protein